MDNLRRKYDEKCLELNMDSETEERAWKRYIEVSQRFKLDGDPTHWFCCALYASCRETSTPTVGENSGVIIGNCVSLTKLLRCCNISIYEFFSKIKRWHDMANLSMDFKKHIENLKRNFSLTCLLCQRYTNIFQQIFSSTSMDKKHSTKFRTTSRCSYQTLCDFSWSLFLCAKNECTDNLDLETLLYLLIACIDFIYKNVLHENRTDLINAMFKKNLPEQWNKQDVFAANSDDETEMSIIAADDERKFSIIDELSALLDVVPKEAKNFKKSKWQPIMKKLLETNNIYGNKRIGSEVLSNSNFDRSWKSLNAAYEQYILDYGAFDERILLNNHNIHNLNSTEKNVFNQQQQHQQSNVDYAKSSLSFSPEICSHQQSRQLTTDLDVPGDKMRKLMENTFITNLSDVMCNVSDAVLQKINTKIDDMLIELNTKCGNKFKDLFGLIKSLYFQLLEKIIRVEVTNKPHINIESFLDTDAFNSTLIVCSIEIVHDSYNLELKFPWILDFFKIDGFIFFKIIELVVGRHENLLNRMHVKHLNSIEECCLESLAWRDTSDIWEIVEMLQTFPTWADVDKHNAPNMDNLRFNLTGSITKLETAAAAAATTTKNNINETARKDLFNFTKNEESPYDANNEQQTSAQQPAINRKILSLSIFLRKFYKLGWSRLKDLCCELNMHNDLDKIWTLFEYSITQRTHLLRDRHLDQIIMCAIYIYVKVTESEHIKFTDIMKAYRKQPQAVSNTYRDVLIQYKKNENGEKQAEQNDLIFFYNNVYRREMSPYCLIFSKKKSEEKNLLLSPHPSERHSIPKQLLSNHKIFVSPMEKGAITLSPKPLIFGIGKSPAKELQIMNDVVKRGKRNLPFNDNDCDGSPDPKYTRYAPAHLSSLAVVMKDRRAETFHN